MRFLLNPVGSSGDVHPYVGIGRELHARGHEVIVLSAEPHRAVVEASGLRFVASGTRERYDAATRDPDLWHPRRGFAAVLRMIVPVLEVAWQALEANYLPGETVLVGHPLGFVARSFEERTGVPAATIHLSPSSLRTAYQVPALPPGVDISPLPLGLKRALWVFIDRAMIDPQIVPPLNQWRATHDLPPVRRVFQDWINSPRQVIGMFPEWFGARQPDWPTSFAYASFPLWDDPGAGAADQELTAFLDAGAPPVVVTPGSANRHAGSFFAAAAEGLRRLGRRGLFLTGYPEQLPPELPDTILVRSYAPFSSVLPRSAAMIHHGGIGTLAQCLAAGVPQLIMPMAFDQPDNALRARKLGVARWHAPAEFTGDNVAASLTELLDSAEVRRLVLTCRSRLAGIDGIGMTCDRLEPLARGAPR